MKELEDWMEKLNWAVQSLCVCCYGTPNGSNGKSASSPMVDSTVVAKLRNFARWTPYTTLEQAVIDLASDIVPGKRRLAIYYGDAERLEPYQRPGWWNADPPILTKSAAVGKHELSVPGLLEALQAGKRLYVPDVDAAEHPEDRIALAIPGRDTYKTVAIVPIQGFRSFTAAKNREALLLGAILIQHADYRAIGSKQCREVLSMLGSLLGVALVHTCLLERSTRRWVMSPLVQGFLASVRPAAGPHVWSASGAGMWILALVI
jgi:hypothetical protein